MELAHAAPFSLGGFAFSPATREVVTPAGPETLEPRVMQVLVALHDAGGAVLTRDELIERCWDGVVVGDDAINRAIGKLRRLSEADDKASFRIDNVARVGFRLVTLSEAGTQPTLEAEKPFWRRRRIYVATGVLLTLALAAGLGALRLQTIWAARAAGAPSVAVLPFDSLSGSVDDRALADAITVTLGDQLSRTGLRVMARSSTLEFRGDRKALAGAKLGARYLLDGDVQRLGDQLKITARLDDAARHVTVWSGSFEGPAADPGRVEQRAASAVGAAIAWPGAKMMLANGARMDPEAIALFLSSSAADKRNDRAVALDGAHRLIALAPDLPLAQANLAIITGHDIGFIPAADRGKALAEARRAARQALRGDPGLGEAYVGQSLVTNPIDFAGREAVLTRGVNADPDNEVAYTYLYLLQATVGRNREALGLIQHAASLDPLAVNYGTRTAQAQMFLGDYAAAERGLADVAQRWPDYDLAGLRLRLALFARRFDAAQALLDNPLTGPRLEPPGLVQPMHAMVRALKDRRPADIDLVVRSCADGPSTPDALTRNCLYVLPMLGQLDAAFRIADRIFPDMRVRDARADERWFAAPAAETNLFVLFAPPLAPMRADPRFAALAERMGLADYWRKSGLWPDFCASEPNSVCASLRTARR